jgi:hypothetical protein
MSAPRHGERRHLRTVTEHGPPVEFQDARTGETVYAGPAHSHTYPVNEVYCARCGAWKEVRGLFGLITGCPGCGADWGGPWKE